jgi:hypothetical protein
MQNDKPYSIAEVLEACEQLNKDKFKISKLSESQINLVKDFTLKQVNEIISATFKGIKIKSL